MIYIKNNNYDKNFIKDFYLWLAKYLNIKTTYSDLETSAFNDIQIIFTAKDYTSVKLLLKSLEFHILPFFDFLIHLIIVLM